MLIEPKVPNKITAKVPYSQLTKAPAAKISWPNFAKNRVSKKPVDAPTIPVNASGIAKKRLVSDGSVQAATGVLRERVITISSALASTASLP